MVMLHRACLAALVAAVSCAPGERVHTPALDGPVWGVPFDGGPLAVYVVRRTWSRQVVDPGSDVYRTEFRTQYELAVRRIPDGALLHALPLAVSKVAVDPKPPRVLGIVGDVVWLWRDSLEARRLPALDPASLPPTPYSTGVEDRFDHLVPPGRSRAMTDASSVMQRTFLTSTGQWYALLSESERANVSRWPQARAAPSGPEVVRLARDGTVLWRTSTGIAEPHEMLDLESHIAFVGPDATPGSDTDGPSRQLLVWIDQRTGARRALSIATGEVRE